MKLEKIVEIVKIELRKRLDNVIREISRDNYKEGMTDFALQNDHILGFALPMTAASSLYKNLIKGRSVTKEKIRKYAEAYMVGYFQRGEEDSDHLAKCSIEEAKAYNLGHAQSRSAKYEIMR